MTKPRRRFSDKVPVWDLCDELGLYPNVFYCSQKASLFEEIS